jgi:hypothetical protein
MTQNEIKGLIYKLSGLGIISDKRNIKVMNAGPFNIKYAVNNFELTSEDVISLVEENPESDKYELLTLILNDVIDENPADYFALMGIYYVLAWAAFENENPDHFLLTQKGINANLMMQYNPTLAEQNKDTVKTFVRVIPDNNSSCDRCKKLAGINYEVTDFLDNLPIPVKGCTKENGICIAGGTIMTALI